MATVWETVTANSTLPVAPGTTFYDHLNNQQAGGGIVRIVEGEPIFVDNLAQSLEVEAEVYGLEITNLHSPINFDDETDVDVFGNDPGLNV